LAPLTLRAVRACSVAVDYAGSQAMSSKSLEREEAAATPRSSKAWQDYHADIPLASLPEYARQKLASLDTNGDGVISVAEIMHHGAELERSQGAVRHYRRLLVLLMIGWLASLAAVFGVVTAGVTVTRQTRVDGGSGTSVMTTKDGSSVVHTGLYTVTQEASSQLDDSVWQSLTHFSIESPTNSWLRLAVLSTARIQGPGTYGSVIQARRACAPAAALVGPTPARLAGCDLYARYSSRHTRAARRC
jgi:hypothetical protein